MSVLIDIINTLLTNLDGIILSKSSTFCFTLSVATLYFLFICDIAPDKLFTNSFAIVTPSSFNFVKLMIVSPNSVSLLNNDSFEYCIAFISPSSINVTVNPNSWARFKSICVYLSCLNFHLNNLFFVSSYDTLHLYIPYVKLLHSFPFSIYVFKSDCFKVLNVGFLIGVNIVDKYVLGYAEHSSIDINSPS